MTSPHCKRESTAPSEPAADRPASQLPHRRPPFSASNSRRPSSSEMSADQPYAAATAASRASCASASRFATVGRPRVPTRGRTWRQFSSTTSWPRKRKVVVRCAGNAVGPVNGSRQPSTAKAQSWHQSLGEKNANKALRTEAHAIPRLRHPDSSARCRIRPSADLATRPENRASRQRPPATIRQRGGSELAHRYRATGADCRFYEVRRG